MSVFNARNFDARTVSVSQSTTIPIGRELFWTFRSRQRCELIQIITKHDDIWDIRDNKATISTLVMKQILVGEGPKQKLVSLGTKTYQCSCKTVQYSLDECLYLARTSLIESEQMVLCWYSANGNQNLDSCFFYLN